MRKVAVNLSIATHSGLDSLLQMPRKELVELGEEVAEAWQQAAR